jgi:predicted nucleotidyltransferase
MAETASLHAHSETPQAPRILPIDAATARAAQAFMMRIAPHYPVQQALLFGSRARGTHTAESDADIAIILQGTQGTRATTAIEMAGVAFEVMLETGILVEALPLWVSEWEHPEHFNNPALITTITREGIAL